MEARENVDRIVDLSYSDLCCTDQCWNVLIQKGCSFSFSFRKEGLLSGDYIHDLLGLLSDLR